MPKRALKEGEDFKTVLKGFGDSIVLVDFHAQWCGPCKMIAPKVEKLVEDENIQLLTVDVDDCSEVAEAEKISAMPTFHIYKNGKRVTEVVGANIEKLTAAVKEAK